MFLHNVDNVINSAFSPERDTCQSNIEQHTRAYGVEGTKKMVDLTKNNKHRHYYNYVFNKYQSKKMRNKKPNGLPKSNIK